MSAHVEHNVECNWDFLPEISNSSIPSSMACLREGEDRGAGGGGDS